VSDDVRTCLRDHCFCMNGLHTSPLNSPTPCGVLLLWALVLPFVCGFAFAVACVTVGACVMVGVDTHHPTTNSCLTGECWCHLQRFRSDPHGHSGSVRQLPNRRRRHIGAQLVSVERSGLNTRFLPQQRGKSTAVHARWRRNEGVDVRSYHPDSA
jgi:hypothetical protein